jgi:hypothetical protein
MPVHRCAAYAEGLAIWVGLSPRSRRAVTRLINGRLDDDGIGEEASELAPSRLCRGLRGEAGLAVQELLQVLAGCGEVSLVE